MFREKIRKEAENHKSEQPAVCLYDPSKRIVRSKAHLDLKGKFKYDLLSLAINNILVFSVIKHLHDLLD